MSGGYVWRPPADEELTWFRPPEGILPARPTALQWDFDVRAFAFGVSRALESLYLPLSSVRAHLIEGELHTAVAPSGIAERDLAAHKKRMCDSALRFSRDIRAAWQRARVEVEEYSAFMTDFTSAGSTDWFRLRRVRANQWFAPMRAVIVPAALLLSEGIGQTPRAEALSAVEQVRQEVVQRGAELLAQAASRAPAAALPPEQPLRVGPPPTGPEMYLMPEILALLAGAPVGERSLA